MAKSPPDQSQINALEAEILEIYNQAHKELVEKEKKYLAKIQPKWDQAEQLLKAGAISQAEHDAIQANLLKSNPWAEAKKHTADIISKSNEVATAIVNESALGYFTYNANYENYSLENGAGVSFGFGIYDRSTITRLLKDNPDLLPQKKLDPAKDVPWNMKKINTALQQGIIQGESLFQIAKRIADVTSSSNEAAMIRAARTAMTGAQNGGRVASMLEAEKMGLKIQKKWMSTLDNRTRDAHRHLDGQSVPLSEKFKVGKDEIEFPGDPHAAPGLVYNCRCTLVDDFIDFPSTYNRYDNIDGVPIAGMTYEEWAKAKASGADMAPKAPIWSIGADLQTPWIVQPQAIQGLVNKSLLPKTPGTMADFAMNKDWNAYTDLTSLLADIENDINLGGMGEVYLAYLNNTLDENYAKKIDEFFLHNFTEFLNPDEVKVDKSSLPGYYGGFNVKLTTELGKDNSDAFEFYELLNSIGVADHLADEVYDMYLSGSLTPEQDKKISDYLLKNGLAKAEALHPITDNNTVQFAPTFSEYVQGLNSKLGDELEVLLENVGGTQYDIEETYSLFLAGGLTPEQGKKISSFLSQNGLANITYSPSSEFVDKSKLKTGYKSQLNEFINSDISAATEFSNIMTKAMFVTGETHQEIYKSYLDGTMKSKGSIYEECEKELNALFKKMGFTYSPTAQANPPSGAATPKTKKELVIDKDKLDKDFYGMFDSAYQLNGNAASELQDVFFKITKAHGLPPGTAFKQIYNDYLAGLLPPEDEKKLDKAFKKIGFATKEVTVSAGSNTPSEQKLDKSAFTGKGITKVKQEMTAALGKKEADAFYEYLKGSGKAADVWKAYQSGKLTDKAQIDTIEGYLKKLQASKPQTQTGTTESANAGKMLKFGKINGDTAKAYRSKVTADKQYRPYLDSIWDNLTDHEKYSVWEYTHNSHPMNKPLSGYQKGTWTDFVGWLNSKWGTEDTWRRFETKEFQRKYGKNGRNEVDYHKAITNLTKAIQKSTLQEDAWFVRGSTAEGLAGLVADGFSGLQAADIIGYLNAGDTDKLKSLLVGNTFTNHAFTSTGIAFGTGLPNKISYKVLAPKGAHALYCEPASFYGDTIGQNEKIYKIGQRYKHVGDEAEMLFQRGTEFRITSIEPGGGDGEWDIVMEVVSQPDYFTYGDENTADMGKTRHKI